MPYRYCLNPHKFEDGEKIRFLGKVDSIDKISGVFVLDNGIAKVSCIPKDKEIVRNLKTGDIIRVFGRIIKMDEEAEIDVYFIQKVEIYPKIYNKIISKIFQK